MAKDFTTTSELGRVKYLQSLGLSVREIAQFFHESDRMKKPVAENNYLGIKGTNADIQAGNTEMRTTHEDYEKTIKAFQQDSENRVISREEAEIRYKKHLEKKGGKILGVVMKEGKKMFKIDEPFVKFKNIQDSILRQREINKEGKFATDQNYRQKIDRMVKVVEPLFNQEVKGGDIGRTEIELIARQGLYMNGRY
jgi:DNA-binding transcriptional MerR regulator